MISSCFPVPTGRTDLKHTEYYVCSGNSALTPILAVSDGTKFLEITYRCVDTEAKKDL